MSMMENSQTSFSLGQQALEKLLSLVLYVMTSMLTSFSSTLHLIGALAMLWTQSLICQLLTSGSQEKRKSSSSTKPTTSPKTVKKPSGRSSKSSKTTVGSSSPATTPTTSLKQSTAGVQSLDFQVTSQKMNLLPSKQRVWWQGNVVKILKDNDVLSLIPRSHVQFLEVQGTWLAGILNNLQGKTKGGELPVWYESQWDTWCPGRAICRRRSGQRLGLDPGQDLTFTPNILEAGHLQGPPGVLKMNPSLWQCSLQQSTVINWYKVAESLYNPASHLY